jgi:hypothetical protein
MRTVTPSLLTPKLRLPRIVLVLLIFPALCELCFATCRPSERLLHAVRYVESSNGRFTYGDKGRSLGDYQLSRAAWTDVNGWRKSRNMRTYSYDIHVWDKSVSRVYAADYLSILHRELTKRLGRGPTTPELYAAYNMGLTGFAQCGYQLARVNPTTARKSRLVKELAREQ